MALASSPLLSTNVAVSLYNSLKEGLGKSENIFFSPFSIAVALSMVKHGARGESLQQLHNLLSKSDVAEAKKAMVTIKSTSDSSFKVTTANRAWVQKSYDIVQEYIDFLKNEFGSSIISADFITDSSAVADEINSWVESETNDKIKNLVTPDSLNELTRLVLVNAVYFKGTWVEQFSKEDTMPRDFHLNKSEKIQTDFMYQEEYMRYGKLDKCTVVGLPYTAPKNMSAHMYVIVPNEIEGLEQVEGDLEKILPKLDSLKREKVKLYLPKFKFEQKTDLVECLKRLGVSHLFDASLCDISGINKELFVSKIFHQALIEVNEFGTEAAAATRADGAERELVRLRRVKSDRPFLFLVLVDGCVLFTGRLCLPEVARRNRERSYSSESDGSTCGTGRYSNSDSVSSNSTYRRSRRSSPDSDDSDYKYRDRRRLSYRSSSTSRYNLAPYPCTYRRSPYYPRYQHYNNNYYQASYYRSYRPYQPYYEPQYRRNHRTYRDTRSSRDSSPEYSRTSHRRRYGN